MGCMSFGVVGWFSGCWRAGEGGGARVKKKIESYLKEDPAVLLTARDS
jgi:hypothetical protein